MRPAAAPLLTAGTALRAAPIALARRPTRQLTPQQPLRQRQQQQQQHVCCSAQTPEQQVEQQQGQQLVGEDAAAFDLSQQSLRSWGIFGVLLTTVLAAMYLVRSEAAAAAVRRPAVAPVCQPQFFMRAAAAVAEPPPPPMSGTASCPRAADVTSSSPCRPLPLSPAASAALLPHTIAIDRSGSGPAAAWPRTTWRCWSRSRTTTHRPRWSRYWACLRSRTAGSRGCGPKVRGAGGGTACGGGGSTWWQRRSHVACS